MVSEEKIERAGRRLAQAAQSPARVILFGSQARGDANAGSDYDFLVVEREIEDRFDEMVRLGRVLAGLRMPGDVVVVTDAYAKEWGGVEGTMVHDALTEGRILAES